MQVRRLLACSFTAAPQAGGAEDRARKKLPPAASPEGNSLEARLRVPIGEQNLGSQMLRKMGWEEGSGLGAQGQGGVQPVPISLKHNRRGLGHLGEGSRGGMGLGSDPFVGEGFDGGGAG